MQDKIVHSARPKAGIAMVEKLGDFFGERIIGELNGQLQRDYAKQRGSQSSARRELEILSAAINYHVKDMVGGVQTLFRPTLPDAAPARERWLTRSEAARLIWAAWRKRARLRRRREGPLHVKAHCPVYSGRPVHRHAGRSDLRRIADPDHRSRPHQP